MGIFALVLLVIGGVLVWRGGWSKGQMVLWVLVGASLGGTISSVITGINTQGDGILRALGSALAGFGG